MSSKMDLHSKIKDVYANPIGHDILYKLLLQLNKSEKLITNPIIKNLRLKTLMTVMKPTLGNEFFETFLELLNSEVDVPKVSNSGITRRWWKEAVFYQIYPRSFKDTDGDGIGDIQGIISKLDYLKELGIDAIWLSPIYDSPNDDNGYDIRDYYNVMNEFGTMEDVDCLLEELHKRDMRLIMDLVVNHTSDEHPWFLEILSNPSSKYKEYYLFQTSQDDMPPNNWNSFFSGSAWSYYEQLGEWGLHLFSKKQMDLNWDNADVRDDIYRMIRWWLEKGVDGFRLDVINYISKKTGLPNGNENIGRLMGFYGIEHYYYGPQLHKYLKEMKQEAFEPYQAFTVGETPGVGMEMSKLLTAEDRKELDMVFSFDHLETPGHVRFEEYQYNLNYLKEYMINWMEHYGDSCWMSLFYENHDNPRMISKVNPDPKYRVVLAKLLAMIQLTLKGTPFIFQGQEIGSVNKNFKSIDELKDIESINLYQELLKTMDKDSALRKVLSGSRDHARTPMQWNYSKNAGFTEGTPWIKTDDDYQAWNVEKQLEREDSILNYYKKLIHIRKNNQALVYGEFKIEDRKRKDIFNFIRKLDKDSFYVECNLSSKPKKRVGKIEGYELILSNYLSMESILRPYEANLYKKL